MIKQLRCIPSDRELYRRLWNDETLRLICDIEEREKPYHPSQMTRFRDRVGPDRLEEIMGSLLEELLEGSIIKGESIALDATFIKAWSRRDPADDSHGLSDPEARVGRDGKSYDLGQQGSLGYGCRVRYACGRGGASANENEKKHVEELLDKASTVVMVKAVVGDSQYSSRRVRDCIVEHGALPVIPYTSNQRCGDEGLRVDRFFRVSGPAEERRMYEVGRAAVERVNSRLGSVGLDCLKLRGLRNAVVHMLLCVVTVLLVAVAALRLSRPWKARSLSSFWW
jgi:hypothetical protein